MYNYPIILLDIINKGFRRCGDFFYHTVNDKSCCPMYTIRLPLDTFKMSKSNKQVLRRFENYLDHGNVTSVQQKEVKKIPPKMSCSFNST